MERASLKKMASKVDAQEYPTKDELFEGSEDIQMTIRSNQKDHVLNTINGDIEFENNNFDKMKKDKQFQSPQRVTGKKNRFFKANVADLEQNVQNQDVKELTFQKEELVKEDLINDIDKTNEIIEVSGVNKEEFLKEGGDEDQSGRRFLKEGGENANDLTNLEGLATNNNIVDQMESPQAEFSLKKERAEQVYDIHEDDRDTSITINSVKKYNRILRGIENGDGQTIDLQGPSLDMYTYSVVMMLNPNVEFATEQNLSQMCMLVPLVQAFIIGIYFWSQTNEMRDDDNQIVVKPTKMYFDFGTKFLCCFLMHMIVKPDLK